MRKLLFILILFPLFVSGQVVVNLSPDSTLYDLHKLPGGGVVDTTIFFVNAISGDDSRPGYPVDSSWQTITRVNAEIFEPGDQVLFNRGDTFNDTILNIGQSGTDGNPITAGAYGTGADPVISGFFTIPSWTDYGAGTIYFYEVAVDHDVLNTLTYDNVNTAMGREPDGSYSAYESHVANTSITDNELGGVPSWIGAEAVIRKTRWMLDRNAITNHVATTLTYTTGSAWTPTDTYGYFVQNSFDALDTEGEWFYDGDTLFVYFGAEAPGDHTVKIAVKDTLVKIISKDYQTYDGIKFEGADSCAFMIQTATNLIIQNCSIEFSGFAIFTNINSVNATLTVDNCFIQDINDQAIDLRGINTFGWIKNNTLNRIGVLPGMGSSNDNSYDGIDGFGNNSIIESNTLDSIGHIGIASRFRSGHIMRYNVISNYGLTRYDAGGIYSWNGADSVTSRTIRKNLTFDSKQTAEGIGAETLLVLAGIYLDEFSNFTTVDSNSAWNNSMSGLYILDSDSNTVDNNTFFDNGVSQIRITHAFGIGVDVIETTITNNILVSKDSSQIAFLYRDDDGDFADLGLVDTNYIGRPVDDDTIFQTFDSPTTANYAMPGWRATFDHDSNSFASPVEVPITDSVQFEYNAGSTNKTVTLTVDKQEMDGTEYSGTVVIPPLESKVLLDIGLDAAQNFEVSSPNKDSIRLQISGFPAGWDTTVINYALADYPWRKKYPTQLFMFPKADSSLYADTTFFINPPADTTYYFNAWLANSSQIWNTRSWNQDTVLVDSLGGAFTAEYQAVLDEMTTDPTGDTLTWQNDMVRDLVDSGYWARMDLFYVLANPENGAAEADINWITPGTFTLTEEGGGALTWTANEGYTGDGTNYLATGFNLSTDNVNYTLDDASGAVYLRLDKNEVTSAIGATNSNNQLAIFPRSGGSFLGRINSNTGLTSAVPNSQGLFMVTRRASNDTEEYKGGASVTSGANASTVLPDDIMDLLARGGGVISTNQISIGFIMDGVSDTEASEINTIIETYMDAIGKGVQ